MSKQIQAKCFLSILAAVGLAGASCSDASSAPGSDSNGSNSGSAGNLGNGGASGSAGSLGVGAIGVGAVAGNGGSGGVAPDGGCAYSSVKSDLMPTNMLFVVDRSATMNCNLPPITASAACEVNPVRADATQPSKWEIVTKSLKEAFTLLPTRASAGLAFFNNDNYCGVNSQPSVGLNGIAEPQIAALTSALDSVPPPKGGTPVIGATIVAYKHLHQQAQAPGNRFVVLLTDGMENCDVDKLTLLQTEVPKARSVNIRTFVIGTPGSVQARALLSQIAWMGGTARDPNCDHAAATPETGDCHFDMTLTQNFGADLAAALASITGKALTCEFDVPKNDGKPIDHSKVNVHYKNGAGGEEDIPQDTTKACEGGAEGWQYNSDRTKIILCGSICGQVKADTGAQIDIVLGCKTVAVPA